MAYGSRHYAAWFGLADVCAALVGRPEMTTAMLNAQESRGRTALHVAVLSKNGVEVAAIIRQ